MDEQELISLQLTALHEARSRVRELERAGEITLSQRDAWLNEIRDEGNRLRRRREKLNETQGGTTPILSPGQAQTLRASVRRLQVHVTTEAALRQLLGEVLSVAEAATSDRSAEGMVGEADLAANDSAAAEPRRTGRSVDEWAQVPAGAASAPLLTLVGGIAFGFLLAKLGGGRA